MTGCDIRSSGRTPLLVDAGFMTKQTHPNSRHSAQDPFIPLRTLVILTASVLVGAIAAAATYSQWHQIVNALSVGCFCALGAARQLHTWTGN